MVEKLAKLLPALSAENVRELRKDFRSAILEAASENAVFKAKVSEGHRVTIPDAERESTGLKVGDLVQVIAIPLRKEE